MIGLVCQSGRYHDDVDSFAQAAMRNGVGVYIGSTQNSFRTSNNNAIEFIEDYVEGMPIGVAFKKIERKMIRDASGLGLPGEHGRYWAYEYNYYGDPAFGTDGSPWVDTRSRDFIHSDSRGDAEYDIEIDEMRFVNDTGGQRAWIPGGSEVHTLGEPIVPFKTFEFSIAEGETVSSVDLEMDSSWSYYSDMEIPLFAGYIIDGGEITVKKGLFTRNQDSVSDPLDNFFPGKTMEWEVMDEGGQRILLVRVYPFQHDGSTGVSRSCESWTLHVNTTAVPVEVVDYDGPERGMQTGDNAEFSTTVYPVGEGGIISISQRIEESGGDLIETLPSSLMDVNMTTEVIGSWDSGSYSGSFVYILELRTIEGCLIRSIEMLFNTGHSLVRLSSFEVDPTTFGNSTTTNATMLISNEGAGSIDGWYSISLLDNQSAVVEEFNGTVNIGQGAQEELTGSFNMSGLVNDVYGIRGMFIHDDIALSDMVLVWNEEVDMDESVVFEAALLFDYPDEINEGEDIVIQGNVTRSDGLLLEGIPVGVWLGDRNFTGNAITDKNGSFEITLLNLTDGNWSIRVQALFGDTLLVKSSYVVVLDVPDGDDDDDDNVTDDDDDDTTDDDDTPDDDTDDDTDDDDTGSDDDKNRKKTNLGLIAGIVIGTLILIIIVFIFIMVRRREEEVYFKGEE